MEDEEGESSLDVLRKSAQISAEQEQKWTRVAHLVCPNIALIMFNLLFQTKVASRRVEVRGDLQGGSQVSARNFNLSQLKPRQRRDL